MAGLAKSTNRMTVLQSKDRATFVKIFNSKIPDKQFMDSCKKAGELFNEPRTQTHRAVKP